MPNLHMRQPYAQVRYFIPQLRLLITQLRLLVTQLRLLVTQLRLFTLQPQPIGHQAVANGDQSLPYFVGVGLVQHVGQNTLLGSLSIRARGRQRVIRRTTVSSRVVRDSERIINFHGIHGLVDSGGRCRNDLGSSTSRRCPRVLVAVPSQLLGGPSSPFVSSRTVQTVVRDFSCPLSSLSR